MHFENKNVVLSQAIVRLVANSELKNGTMENSKSKNSKFLQSFFPRINIAPFALRRKGRTCLEQHLQKRFSLVSVIVPFMYFIVLLSRLLAFSLMLFVINYCFSYVSNCSCSFLPIPYEFFSVPMQGVR